MALMPLHKMRLGSTETEDDVAGRNGFIITAIVPLDRRTRLVRLLDNVRNYSVLGGGVLIKVYENAQYTFTQSKSSTITVFCSGNVPFTSQAVIAARVAL